MAFTIADTSKLEEVLVEAQQDAIAHVLEQSSRYIVPQMTWRHQEGIGGWVGTYEGRPELVRVFSTLFDHPVIQTVKSAFDDHMPGFLGKIRISGFSDTCSRPYDVVTGLLNTIWNRYQSFAVVEEVLRSLARELIQSLRDRKVTLAFLAPIRDFRLSGVEQVVFPNGVIIRRLHDHEATRLYGGLFPAFKTSFAPPGDFTFAGDLERPFTVGEEDVVPTKTIRESIVDRLVTAEEVLMITKPGPIVHDWISIGFAKPSPTGTLFMGLDGAPRPLDQSYEMATADVPIVEQQFAAIQEIELPTLQIACKRLADSERRSRPIDAIMDAVIGLEALLLDGKDRTGLRFRFALNYATLPPDLTPDVRRSRFRAALDLYKVRNEIVHLGANEDRQFKIAGESLSLKGIAEMAKQMLRSSINDFLRLDGVPGPGSARDRWFVDFWESGYFGQR